MSLEDKLAENTAALVALTAEIKAGRKSGQTAEAEAKVATNEAPKETAKEAITRKAKEKAVQLAEIEAKALADRTNEDLMKQNIAAAEAEESADGAYAEDLPNLHPDEKKSPAYYDKYVFPAVTAAQQRSANPQSKSSFPVSNTSVLMALQSALPMQKTLYCHLGIGIKSSSVSTLW